MPLSKPGGFDVTAVIGRVRSDTKSDQSAFHAAMELIADHAINLQNGQALDYHFPGVTVGVKMDAEAGPLHVDR